MGRGSQESLQTVESKPIQIVGIGASAGGLEALEQFFEHVPGDTGLAFVVVQHLSPHYKSFMPEILERRTKMPINIACENMRVEPDQIYLIPPHQYLSLSDSMFHLQEYPAASGVHLPIDVFFSSLARELGRQAIGIVLSGTGTDGTRGIRDINRAGGIVMAQDEDSSKFAGMPVSAVSTGLVHFILPPEEMAKHLFAIADRTYRTMEPVVLPDFTDLGNEEEVLGSIFAMIKRQSGTDFSGYKSAGVMRRVERRMKMIECLSLMEYLQVLVHSHEEVDALQKDLLIGVTQFFRDREAFSVISKQVIPQIIEEKLKTGDRQIRIWIAGCSTGEEAYSLAILFQDYMDNRGLDLSVRIFATDLDADAIQFASHGFYPVASMEDVPPHYLDRYFAREGDAYQIRKEIRKLVVFAPHNIIKDPPFVNLDMVSCRNMMIYFQADLQKKILTLFHFALNKKGFLFLGPSESIGKLTNLYLPFEKKWNIFRYREQKEFYISHSLEISGEQESESAEPRPHVPLASLSTDQQVIKKLGDVYATLIDEYMPPSLVIDPHNDVVHICGDVAKFVQVPRGKMSFNIFKMVSTQLSVAIGTGVHKVRKEQKPVHFSNIRLHSDDPAVINLLIKPFSSRTWNGMIMIVFEEIKPLLRHDSDVEYLDFENDANSRIRDLERELQFAQESLQATIEELETSNEELQSTNEELIASNEELQSTNEELQSVNEELISVNAEHQRKIEELTELNNDMDNFLISTKIGTIFLDRDLCIRRFTPAVKELIHLLEVDIGRPINHISHKLKYEFLLQDARQVLSAVAPLEKEVQSIDGKWYSMGILPYRTTENMIKGVVITFVEITELKRANKELQKLYYAIHQSPQSILIADGSGRIEYANPKLTEKMGYGTEEVVGLDLRAYYERTTDPAVATRFEEIWRTLQAGDKWVGELRKQRKNGPFYWEEASFIPLLNDKGEIIHYLKAATDITERKRTQELLRKSEMHSAVGQLAAGVAHEIRNPLTALKGFLQLIQADGEKNETYIKIMLSEFGRIETIINELLLLSKPHVLNFQQVDVPLILNDVLMLLDTQAILNKVTIKTDVPADLPCIECIQNQIKQVFINVLKNAIEAMPNGGNVQLAVRKTQEGTVLVRFQDDGVGIPEEIIQRIGEPFYSTKEKGTGLGMMVSYKIIEDHHGTMSIKSKVGQGTIIDIELPHI